MVQQNRKDTKVIAMYLPQFHEIPENNEWWGKGFTEWTNVKKSKPLYKGHWQPQLPLNKNFYDLSDVNVMKNQMKMAKHYGVDGFCFYHYWFNGKKLLEKPIERLLDSQDIELPFCLCWANEPWTRTWDGSLGAKHILMEQHYGSEEDWIKHFEYLNLFFRQEQYIKVDGKPVMVIYDANNITCWKKMIETWDKLAIREGYRGIYIITVHRLLGVNENSACGNGVMDFEPYSTMKFLDVYTKEKMSNEYQGKYRVNREISYHVIDYAKFCEYMVNKYIRGNKNHFLGFFAGWDNTPRRGIDTRIIFENNTPEIFEKYFEIQYKKSQELNNHFMFINAWNEWGEGTCLEPTQRYKYGYLEAIQRVKKNNQASN